MNKKKDEKGWECPRCGSINSPQKDKCQCKPQVKEEAQDNRQLLLEG